MNERKTEESHIFWTEQVGLEDMHSLLEKVGYGQLSGLIRDKFYEAIVGIGPEELKEKITFEYDNIWDACFISEYNVFKLMEEDFCNLIKQFEWVLTDELVVNLYKETLARFQELYKELDPKLVSDMWFSRIIPVNGLEKEMKGEELL